MNQINDAPGKNLVEPAIRVFPIEGTNLSKILSDPQHRKLYRARLKTYNPQVVALYRTGLLHLFGVSQTVMLLMTKGNKTGKVRSTPIGYFRIGGVIHLFSAWGKNTSWYKNMTANPNDIWIQIGLRKRRVQAQVLEEPAEAQHLLEQFVTESPSQARSVFGWEPGRDRIECADFSKIIQHVLMVRFVEKTE